MNAFQYALRIFYIPQTVVDLEYTNIFFKRNITMNNIKPWWGAFGPLDVPELQLPSIPPSMANSEG